MRQIHIGRITFGPPSIEVLPAKDRFTLRAPPPAQATDSPTLTDAKLARLGQAIDAAGAVMDRLRADKARLTCLLLLAEAALARADEANTGPSLYGYIRDRIRQELGERGKV